MTAMLRSPDRITRTALLGVRFWDEVTRTPVQDGPVVELRHAANPYKRLRAIPNKRGIHVLHDAPGLRRSAYGTGDDQFWRNPPEGGELVLEVTDASGHFQPLEMTAHLPTRGFFTPDCLVASPPAAEGYIPLFSTPVRPIPSGMAVVRMELRDWVHGKPVRWALLVVKYQDQMLGRGVADREGKVAVLFPYPEPESHRRASPPEVPTQPSWNLELEVFHSPSLLSQERPDLCALLAQPRARLLDGLSPAADLGPQELTLGRELIVRSATSPFISVT